MIISDMRVTVIVKNRVCEGVVQVINTEYGSVLVDTVGGVELPVKFEIVAKLTEMGPKY